MSELFKWIEDINTGSKNEKTESYYDWDWAKKICDDIRKLEAEDRATEPNDCDFDKAFFWNWGAWDWNRFINKPSLPIWPWNNPNAAKNVILPQNNGQPNNWWNWKQNWIQWDTRDLNWNIQSWNIWVKR